MDSLYQPLPKSVHVYFTNDQPDTGFFRAYYIIADLKDKHLDFTVDTADGRRLTPSVFFERNNKPLVVVNSTFFSYSTNRSINAVIKDGELVAYNQQSIAGRGQDTFTYRHSLGSAIGISKKGQADIAWLYTDSVTHMLKAFQHPMKPVRDSSQKFSLDSVMNAKDVIPPIEGTTGKFLQWKKMRTAVGGGPVLMRDGEIHITNNEELKFTGKAINDKHPRTAMGYTRDGKLIILMVEGRHESASGATLRQEAQIFKDLGCWEAINLDGGGSSCLLLNGKETIKVSDKEGQRPVPVVFLVKIRNKE